MAEFAIHLQGHLPNAHDLTAPCIAYAEGSNDDLMNGLDQLAGHYVQVTVPTGSFEAVVCENDPVTVGDDGGEYTLNVRRFEADDSEKVSAEPESIPLTELRRVYVY